MQKEKEIKIVGLNDTEIQNYKEYLKNIGCLYSKNEIITYIVFNENGIDISYLRFRIEKDDIGILSISMDVKERVKSESNVKVCNEYNFFITSPYIHIDNPLYESKEDTEKKLNGLLRFLLDSGKKCIKTKKIREEYIGPVVVDFDKYIEPFVPEIMEIEGEIEDIDEMMMVLGVDKNKISTTGVLGLFHNSGGDIDELETYEIRI